MSVYESNVQGHELLRRGKVRDIYSMGGKPQLMIVACDRISAFDCILPTPVPGKGALLTQMSNFWFSKTENIIKNHLVETNPGWVKMDCGCGTCGSADAAARTVIVHKAENLPVEAIVRGYISGSGWKDYQKTGMVGGIKLKEGLRESDRLDEPIFTPSTKAEVGLHDENISYEKMVEIVGAPLAEKVRSAALNIYKFAADYALKRGIIIADTKFEFGLIDGELVLIDEILTPDSSRFWPVDSYAPGGAQPSYDKQYVRDYLESLDWNKEPPAPELPAEVVTKTADKYREAMRLLTEE